MRNTREWNGMDLSDRSFLGNLLKCLSLKHGKKKTLQDGLSIAVCEIEEEMRFHRALHT